MRISFRLIVLTILLLQILNAHSQIGVGTGMVSAENSDKFETEFSYWLRAGYSFNLGSIPRDNPFTILFIEPGVRFFGFDLKKPLIPNRVNGRTEFSPDPDPDHQYKDECWKTSNRMSFTYLNLTLDSYIPINTGDSTESIIVSPGLFAEYQIGGRFKRRYYEDGNEQVVKTPYRSESHYYGLNRFQAGVQIEVRWKFITLFANHSFIPLFKKGEGPHLRQSSFGLFLWIFPNSGSRTF